MKTLALALVAVATLGGCASMDERSSSKAPSNLDVDSEYVARVDEIARSRGIGVTWVNVPTKKIQRHE